LLQRWQLKNGNGRGWQRQNISGESPFLRGKDCTKSQNWRDNHYNDKNYAALLHGTLCTILAD
jgi:hypothetical protein